MLFGCQSLKVSVNVLGKANDAIEFNFDVSFDNRNLLITYDTICSKKNL